MKLKFKISQSTDLAPRVIVDRINAKLEKEDYRIINITTDLVEFDESMWKLMSRSKAMTRLDGGTFEINLQDNLASVTFSYYLSLIAPIAVLTAISVCLIINGEYYAPLFFISFYIIAITIHAAILKGVANDMLNEIIR
ncbi:hypothetical protein SAMN05216464_103131 [Mucilaginibacter pineti]|uniref:Uncharacterized protein n=1 Tax=Mucilaginibacter pineti TaxID=1391627 RepID=A0A1G6YZ87_9SPHI|nr:hypothetical protein [Mucilaginibacter pineti]SDD94947.1 hypothetical protein SAMN05216464_103131 [Mucilaginibacter pineti]